MTSLERPRPDLRRLFLVAMAIVTGWLVTGIFFGAQHQLIIQARGYADNLDDRLIATNISMLVWACLTPIVFYLADLFPLRRTVWRRSVAVLIPIALLLAALRAGLDAFVPAFVEGLPMALGDYRRSVLSLFHTHFFFAVVLIGIANFLRLQREEVNRRRAEARFRAELAEARLGRLRADLHPHFLFNALNSVAAVVHTNPTAAREMLQQLTALLRRSLASTDAREVSLHEELELTSSYLAILQMRFGDRLMPSIEVADEVLRDAPIPPLLLQPLVENAIVHGVAHRIDRTRVRVTIDAVGSWLRLQVRDTGPGFSADAIFRREGLGIRNVRARLESLYGEEHSLSFRRESEEFVAEILIPLRWGSDPQALRGLTPSNEGLTPFRSNEGLTPSNEGLTPSNGGLTPELSPSDHGLTPASSPDRGLTPGLSPSDGGLTPTLTSTLSRIA